VTICANQPKLCPQGVPTQFSARIGNLDFKPRGCPGHMTGSGRGDLCPGPVRFWALDTQGAGLPTQKISSMAASVGDRPRSLPSSAVASTSCASAS
jgi:hypothetical protein